MWAGASDGEYVWLRHTRLEAAEYWCAEWTARPTALRTHWLPLRHLYSLPALGVSWHQLANSRNAHKVTRTHSTLPHLLCIIKHINTVSWLGQHCLRLYCVYVLSFPSRYLITSGFMVLNNEWLCSCVVVLKQNYTFHSFII